VARRDGRRSGRREEGIDRRTASKSGSADPSVHDSVFGAAAAAAVGAAGEDLSAQGSTGRSRKGSLERRHASSAPEPEFDRATTRSQLKQRFAQVEAIVSPLLLPLGLEVVLVEQSSGGGVILRISIDRVDNPGTVSLSDCVKVTHLLGECPALDELFPGKYHLEVSSPGVDRPLVRERDFVRFQGEKVLVTTLEPLDVASGRKKFSGRLVGCVAGAITVELGRDGTVVIPLDQIARAQLKPDFADLLRRANERRAEPDLELISSGDEDEEPEDAAEAQDGRDSDGDSDAQDGRDSDA